MTGRTHASSEQGTRPKPTSTHQKETARRAKYVPRACQECRRRRAKCDGKKPSCSRCIERKVKCAYVSDDDHRGTVPKAHARQLRTRISLLERVLRLHHIDIDASIARIASKNEFEQAWLPATVRNASPTEDELCSDFEGDLRFDEPSQRNQPAEARFFGVASGRLELQTPDEALVQDSEYEDNNWHPASYDPVPLDPLETQDLPSRLLKEHLIDCYFEWNHPWCQIVDEDLFRRSEQSGGRYTSPFLLNSILAIGSRYSDQPEVRSHPADPNSAGRVFLKNAEDMFHAQLKKPTITTIQALKLMSMLYVAIGYDAAGWSYHGMAVQLARDMGMNLDSNVLKGSKEHSEEEAKLRRQVYWTLYCDDKFWSSYTGRVCTMLDSHAAVSLPELPQATEGQDGRRTMIDALQHALCTYCQILERIHMDLYSIKRLGVDSHRRSFYDSCFLDLTGWFQSLPDELKIQRSDGTFNKSPQVYTLLMAYHTAIILLAKPFLPKAGDQGQSRSAVNDADRRASSNLDVFAVCFQAAKDTIWIGEKYRQVFGSFRRSPLTATHCTLTAALVMLTASRHPEISHRETVVEHIWTCISILKELSHSWTPAQRYWRTLLRAVEGKSQVIPASGTVESSGGDAEPPMVDQVPEQAMCATPRAPWNPDLPSDLEQPSSFLSFDSFASPWGDGLGPSNTYSTGIGLGADDDIFQPQGIGIDAGSWYDIWDDFSCDGKFF